MAFFRGAFKTGGAHIYGFKEKSIGSLFFRRRLQTTIDLDGVTHEISLGGLKIY